MVTGRVNRQIARQCARSFATATPPAHPEPAQPEPNTHFRITLRRSAIGLPSRIKGTLVALGLHRRMHTVYHKHCPDIAGKILAVKELVQVENVPASAVRTKTEQRRERRAPRGYSIVGSKLQDADL
ncbi:uncharacterized protein LAESUDRAFT_737153 [Laetiporus sulphureus 93-53]|uniref:Large ribosomal subunit protein uL30m n=1 Tax=Laetiporus sulphureus 93-53 TaxID=1314785 RepID=A0A165E308_9APHY|nr:uncharacterized protein LAESUDRAFT_737153 [Laetiporus sulphureus 93-53]KZT06145.1 hypothetical protein LAESUDRAFT_737153 [Laetiporus sulphureus 93-53]